jgi:hypothetical protein
LAAGFVFGLAGGGATICDGMICSSSRSVGCCMPGDERGPL